MARGNQSMEQYAIAQIEQVKHLQSRFTEYELVILLAYHFNHNIQLAVYTQGIKIIEEFLILITQKIVNNNLINQTIHSMITVQANSSYPGMIISEITTGSTQYIQSIQNDMDNNQPIEISIDKRQQDKITMRSEDKGGYT